ncbi:MAG: HAMP domain-containing sensor histidine kinase [Acidimicrobiia bacterium]
MSLRVRLAAIMASAVFIAFLVAAGASFIATTVVLRESLTAELEQTARLVAEDPAVVGFGVNLSPQRRSGSVLGSDTVVELLNLQGYLEAQVGGDHGIDLTERQRLVLGATGFSQPEYQVVDDIEYRVVTLGYPNGAVRVSRPTTANAEALAQLRADLIRFGIVAAGVAAGIGAAVANRITRPVARLTEVAEEIAETGNLDRRIETDRIDEVGRLATAFNRMITALSTSRDQQHRLVMDASHELRTPLTSLRTNIEVLRSRRDQLAAGQRDELLGDVSADVVELSDLVAELVELATDQHTAELAERLRLDDVAEQAAERTRRRRGREVVVELEPCEVIGRPAMLDRAIGNLLENAHKWSPPGAPIRLTLAGGELAVHDQGPGIAPGDREKVFDRFYRSIDAQNTPGSGLGLAIVKQTVEVHGGTVFVGDSPDGGAVVGFRLPGVRLLEPERARSGRAWRRTGA